MQARISASVGRGGRNAPPDGAVVQHLLAQRGFRPGKPDSVCGPRSAHVERTFAWLSRSRRLARNLENLAWTSIALIRLAMIKLMAERLARP